ncbi:DNA polymerase III subunit delta' [bacterium SCSIO 12741]|nr:DNA polymerase III subunit delta' [bacterium SCSIO 12741]
MKWTDVIGQEVVKKHLLDALHHGRIPHAQLFIGPEGSGALPLALAYARSILCQLKNGEWLDEEITSSAYKLDKYVHPDLHFVFPVNKSDTVKTSHPTSDNFIAAWRESLLENPYHNLTDWYETMGIGNKQGLIGVHESVEILKKLSLKPYEGEYKVMIIWMMENMNVQTANKLLKILEEPPEKTVFILIAEDGDQILPTITSRTQLVKVPRLQNSDLEEALISRHQLPAANVKEVVRLAEGNYHRALALINHDEHNNRNREEFIHWMRLCFARKPHEILNWIDGISRQNRESLKTFFEYGLHLFRECLMMNFGAPELVHLEGEELAFAKKFCLYINQANCQGLIEEFELAIRDVQRNANTKILFYDLSIHIMKLLRVKA